MIKTVGKRCERWREGGDTVPVDRPSAGFAAPPARSLAYNDARGTAPQPAKHWRDSVVVKQRRDVGSHVFRHDSFFDRAIEDDDIERSPMDRINVKTLAAQERHTSDYNVDPLSELEIFAFLVACRKHRTRRRRGVP